MASSLGQSFLSIASAVWEGISSLKLAGRIKPDPRQWESRHLNSLRPTFLGRGRKKWLGNPKHFLWVLLPQSSASPASPGRSGQKSNATTGQSAL